MLNEVTNVLRRKSKMPWAEVRLFLSTLRDLLTVHDVSVGVHEQGLALADRYGLSVYDATIAASAIEAGYDVLWSEDMHDGLTMQGRLRVANPFRQ